jgi:hypothetical protein
MLKVCLKLPMLERAEPTVSAVGFLIDTNIKTPFYIAKFQKRTIKIPIITT